MPRLSYGGVEADLGRRPGFPRCNVLAGGPGSLSKARVGKGFAEAHNTQPRDSHGLRACGTSLARARALAKLQQFDKGCRRFGPAGRIGGAVCPGAGCDAGWGRVGF